MYWNLFILLFSFSFVISETKPCALRKVTSHGIDGFVCVCNATYCDTVDDFEVLPGQVLTFSSTASGHRLSPSRFDYHSYKQMYSGPVVTVKVNSSQHVQTILGFGAAFTDAAGINLLALSQQTQKQLLEAYFHPIKGIGYTIGRVPIGSSDFSTHSYSYDDYENDFALRNFSLADEDIQYKIPVIKAAQKLSPNLTLFGSPWSPPAWMKTSKSETGSSGIIGDVDGSYYASWGKYFGRFLQEYAKRDIDFWAVTIQNEPTGCYGWQCLLMNGTVEAEFAQKQLRPALNRAGFKNVKIIANDDARSVLPPVVEAFRKNHDAANSIDGYGTHWYSKSSFAPLVHAHEIFPDKFILPTEACNGYEKEERGPYLGSWERGVRYAQDIIGNLNSFAVGWVDWNFCLDQKGSPNWAQNFVDAPIITNAPNEFYKQPMYYVLGHFSRFLPPGSVIIQSSVNESKNGISLTSGITPQNDTVLILLNKNNYQQTVKLVDVTDSEKEFTLNIDSNSITTVIWKSFPKMM